MIIRLRDDNLSARVGYRENKARLRLALDFPNEPTYIRRVQDALGDLFNYRNDEQATEPDHQAATRDPIPNDDMVQKEKD